MHPSSEGWHCLSENDTQDIAPALAEAFAAFNRSADKLGAVYGQLAARTPVEESDLPGFRSYDHPLLLAALECVPGGVIVVDVEGRTVAINTTAQYLTCLNENQMVNSMSIFAETLDTATALYSRIHSPSGVAVEIHTTPIGDACGRVIGAVGVLRPGNTETQKTGNVQRRSSATSPDHSLAPVFTAIGDIVINIAHRMRSPLSAIQLFAELLKQDLDQDKQNIVDDILVGAHSLDAVLSNLLSFAQPVKPKFREVNLAEILGESLLFAAPAIKQQAISLVKRYSHDELCCYGDLEQLRQVCFNLILNAIQAMPEGGELRITASHIYEASAGEYINLEIEDNGCGIADEAIDRVFTPFFTTKEGGTGLGLCVVYRVIQAHHGAVQISSNCGHGTTVSIQLPMGRSHV